MPRFRLFAIANVSVAMVACQTGGETPAPTPAATKAPLALDKTLLTWQGQTDAGCSTVSVMESRRMTVGLCGQLAGDAQVIQQEDSLIFLEAMAERLGPIDDSESADHLM